MFNYTNIENGNLKQLDDFHLSDWQRFLKIAQTHTLTSLGELSTWCSF